MKYYLVQKWGANVPDRYFTMERCAWGDKVLCCEGIVGEKPYAVTMFDYLSKNIEQWSHEIRIKMAQGYEEASNQNHVYMTLDEANEKVFVPCEEHWTWSTAFDTVEEDTNDDHGKIDCDGSCATSKKESRKRSAFDATLVRQFLLFFRLRVIKCLHFLFIVRSLTFLSFSFLLTTNTRLRNRWQLENHRMLDKKLKYQKNTKPLTKAF